MNDLSDLQEKVVALTKQIEGKVAPEVLVALSELVPEYETRHIGTAWREFLKEKSSSLKLTGIASDASVAQLIDSFVETFKDDFLGTRWRLLLSMMIFRLH